MFSGASTRSAASRLLSFLTVKGLLFSLSAAGAAISRNSPVGLTQLFCVSFAFVNEWEAWRESVAGPNNPYNGTCRNDWVKRVVWQVRQECHFRIARYNREKFLK